MRTDFLARSVGGEAPNACAVPSILMLRTGMAKHNPPLRIHFVSSLLLCPGIHGRRLPLLLFLLAFPRIPYRRPRRRL